MRQWITEGRVDGNTQARAENGYGMAPAFDFSGILTAAPAPGADPAAAQCLGPRQAGGLSLHEVSAPAICLIVTAILNILLALWNIASSLGLPRPS